MGPLIRICVLGILLVFAAATRVSAQVTAPPPDAAEIPLSKIPRVHRAPKLEDFLENRPREAELTVSDFRQNIPGDGTPASESTIAYLSYDNKNRYVAFLCNDDGGEVRAHLSKREDSDQDDSVGVLLDTFRDFHRAYFFYSNPLGVQTDAIYTEGQGYDFSFDTLWDNAGRVTPDGYIVFFSIPFKSLRFSHAPEQTWGLALYRVILRKSEYDYWPYMTQRVEGLTQQFAPVGGLEHVSPGRNIQLIPYGLLASDHFLNQPGPAISPNPATPPGFMDKFEHRAGLDAKFVAKDSLTFDVTLNPDFSQVESDDPQVTINQRFAVFFPEKRPFFIENAGFFMTPINLFFSRQIANPQFGSRMTGKLGKWTLGALIIDDRQPGMAFSSGPYNTRAADGVLRVTRRPFTLGRGRTPSPVSIAFPFRISRGELDRNRAMLYGLTRRTPAGILPSPPTTTTSRQIFALSWDSSIASTSGRTTCSEDISGGRTRARSSILDPQSARRWTGTTRASCRTGEWGSVFRLTSQNRAPLASTAVRPTSYSKASVSENTARPSSPPPNRINGSPSPPGTRRVPEKISFQLPAFCHSWQTQTA